MTTGTASLSEDQVAHGEPEPIVCTMTTGAASSPEDQVAHGEPEPIVETRTIGAASLPEDQVAHDKSEPIVTAPQLPLTVGESAPAVASAAANIASVASLPVEDTNPYMRPWKIFPPAPFIQGPSPSQPPAQSFAGYPRFNGPVAPWQCNYNNTPVSAMEYSQWRPRSSLPPHRAPHELVFPNRDYLLHGKIVTQIEYYFSYDNLVKDTYLRQNMDDHGWVAIELISNFNKVKQLTNDIGMILYALRTSSSVVEVCGHKVRRRNDWKRWILSAKIVFPRGKFSK